MRPLIAMLALALSLGACSTADDGSPLAMNGTAMSRTTLDLEDASVGAREHPRLIQGFGGIYRNAKLEAVLNGIVADLVPASERPDLRYQVTILNSPSVNAFALPGGYLYVTRGLLVLANDESEIAAVLAHEMAHVTARHAAQREEKAKSAALASKVMAELMKDQRAGAVSLAASQVSLAGFSRLQELEADSAGIATIVKAGFEPAALARFLVSMNRQFDFDQASSRTAKDRNFLSTHPTTPERIERAASLARTARTLPELSKRTSRETYLAALEGALYGDDAREGYARGRRFVHPELGFSFSAPEGFALENTSRAVFGAGRNGEAMRFDGSKVPGSGPPVDLITSSWIEGATIHHVQPIIVDGLPAATALATTAEWTFRLGAIRHGDMVYRFVLGAKTFTPEIDRMFLESIRSFRKSSNDRPAGVKPHRIRIVKVGPGDTAAGLARRMTGEGDRLQRFLILNGLKAGQALQPGSFVKIVAEGAPGEGA